MTRLTTYGYAAMSEGVVALAGFSVMFLLGAKYPPETVATYLLIRRVVALLEPATALGMPLALVRNLVLYPQGGRLVALAVGIPLTTVAALSIVAVVSPDAFTALALGSSDYAELAWPIIIAVLGIVATGIGIGVLQARQRVGEAATFVIVVLGGLPLLLAALTPDLASFLLFLGGSQTLLATFIVAKDILRHWAAESIDARGFIAFGAKSTMANFTMMLFLWLPSATIAHGESIEISGYFSLIISIVLVLSSPIAPVSQSVMPKISMMVARNNVKALRRVVLIFLFLSVVGGSLMVCLGGLFYSVIVEFVLGDESVLDLLDSLLLLCTIIPLTMWYGVRNTINVVWSPLRNTFILICGVVVFFLVWNLLHHWSGYLIQTSVVAGFTVALWSIGGIAFLHALTVIKRSRAA